MQKVIKVDIKDLEDTKHFSVRLFDVLDGLDFMDRALGAKDKSIKSMLADLLPLATLLDSKGEEALDVMSIDKAGTYFQNPLAVVELGLKVFDHQKVFMKESEVFRPYLEALEKASLFPTLG